MQRNVPATFDAARYLVAHERYLRRCSLWHAARLACPDYATFRANAGAIERAIAALLDDENGTAA